MRTSAMTFTLARMATVALMAVGLFTLIAGAVEGAAPGSAAAPGGSALASPGLSAARRMTAVQLAGHAVIMRFNGNPAPAYVGEALREGRAAGVILFRDNATSPAATRTLTRGLQRAASGRAIIATDQEGGAIRILPWAAPALGQPQVSSPAEAEQTARATARDLRRAGVNLNLAPVADRSGPGTVMRTRAFPGGTARVARITAGAVRGYRGTGVQPTIKHFPGLGAANGNTDDVRVTVQRTADAIGRADLPPFQAAISAGAPAVMVSHAVYPALDSTEIASQSRAVVSELLKQRLGFGGVAMTDSLEAFAVRSPDERGDGGGALGARGDRPRADHRAGLAHTGASGADRRGATRPCLPSPADRSRGARDRPAAGAGGPVSEWDVLIDWCAVGDAREPFTRWVAEHAISDSELKDHVKVDLVRGDDGRELVRVPHRSRLGTRTTVIGSAAGGASSASSSSAARAWKRSTPASLTSS